MAKHALLFVLLSIFYVAQSTTATNPIKASCNAATCTSKQSPQQLLHTALLTGLSRARSSKNFLVKLTKSNRVEPREMAYLQECLEAIDYVETNFFDSVQELKKIVKSRGGNSYQWNNLQTWVSSALTSEENCVGLLVGDKTLGNGIPTKGKLKYSVEASIGGIRNVTATALNLIAMLSSKLAD